MKKHFFTIAYDLIMLIQIIMMFLKVFAVSSANWYLTLLPLFVIIFMKLFVLVKEVIKDFWGTLNIITNNLLLILGIMIVLKIIGISELRWIITILSLIIVFILKAIFYLKHHE